MTKTTEKTAILARLLREIRRERGLSQIDLAAQLGVSQRHVSYVERGLSRPGRQLLQAWLDEVRASDALRNAALLHGGFSSLGDHVQGATATEAPASALALLAAHEPCPAICVDADWMLLASNRARRRLQRVVMPQLPAALHEASSGVDMIDLFARPGGMLDSLRNAAQIGWSVLRQLEAEAWVNHALKPRAKLLEQRLRLRHAEPAPGVLRSSGTTQVDLVFDTAVGRLSFLSTQLLVGLPQNITAAAPRVTLWHPADSFTRAFLLSPAY